MKINQAKREMREYMDRYNLKDWTFELDNAKRRFGYCRHSIKTISMSRILIELNSEERVRMTMLHEIAHAIIDAKHGHDYLWKQTVARIGGVGERCYSLSNTIVPEIKQKSLIYQCPNCAQILHRRKKTNSACKLCCDEHSGGRYDEKFKFVLLKDMEENKEWKN